MASAVLGKVSPTPKGEYVSTQDYDRLDVVTYEGYPYLAKSNVPSGNLPTDELYWMPLLTGLDFAPGGYGLGGQVPLTTADAAVQTGFYRIWLQNTLGYTGYVNLMVMNNNDQIISQTAFGAGNKVFLRIYYNTWGNWVDLSPSAFAPSGYGLGTYGQLLTADNNLNNPLPTGMYRWGSSVPVNAPSPIGYAVMLHIARTDGDSIQKVWHLGTHPGVQISCERYLSDNNGEWEWTNPPMQLGVEYRTTERYLGMPVYVKMIDFGTLPNGTRKNVAHGITGKSYNVRSEISDIGTGQLLEYRKGITEVIANTTDVYITTDSDFSMYSVYFTLWYVK